MDTGLDDLATDIRKKSAEASTIDHEINDFITTAPPAPTIIESNPNPHSQPQFTLIGSTTFDQHLPGADQDHPTTTFHPENSSITSNPTNSHPPTTLIIPKKLELDTSNNISSISMDIFNAGSPQVENSGPETSDKINSNFHVLISTNIQPIPTIPTPKPSTTQYLPNDHAKSAVQSADIENFQKLEKLHQEAKPAGPKFPTTVTRSATKTSKLTDLLSQPSPALPTEMQASSDQESGFQVVEKRRKKKLALPPSPDIAHATRSNKPGLAFRSMNQSPARLARRQHKYNASADSPSTPPQQPDHQRQDTHPASTSPQPNTDPAAASTSHPTTVPKTRTLTKDPTVKASNRITRDQSITTSVENPHQQAASRTRSSVPSKSDPAPATASTSHHATAPKTRTLAKDPTVKASNSTINVQSTGTSVGNPHLQPTSRPRTSVLSQSVSTRAAVSTSSYASVTLTRTLTKDPTVKASTSNIRAKSPNLPSEKSRLQDVPCTPTSAPTKSDSAPAARPTPTNPSAADPRPAAQVPTATANTSADTEMSPTSPLEIPHLQDTSPSPTSAQRTFSTAPAPTSTPTDPSAVDARTVPEDPPVTATISTVNEESTEPHPPHPPTLLPSSPAVSTHSEPLYLSEHSYAHFSLSSNTPPGKRRVKIGWSDELQRDIMDFESVDHYSVRSDLTSEDDSSASSDSTSDHHPPISPGSSISSLSDSDSDSDARPVQTRTPKRKSPDPPDQFRNRRRVHLRPDQSAFKPSPPRTNSLTSGPFLVPDLGPPTFHGLGPPLGPENEPDESPSTDPQLSISPHSDSPEPPLSPTEATAPVLPAVSAPSPSASPSPPAMEPSPTTPTTDSPTKEPPATANSTSSDSATPVPTAISSPTVAQPKKSKSRQDRPATPGPPRPTTDFDNVSLYDKLFTCPVCRFAIPGLLSLNQHLIQEHNDYQPTDTDGIHRCSQCSCLALGSQPNDVWACLHYCPTSPAVTQSSTGPSQTQPRPRLPVPLPLSPRPGLIPLPSAPTPKGISLREHLQFTRARAGQTAFLPATGRENTFPAELFHPKLEMPEALPYTPVSRPPTKPTARAPAQAPPSTASRRPHATSDPKTRRSIPAPAAQNPSPAPAPQQPNRPTPQVGKTPPTKTVLPPSKSTSSALPPAPTAHSQSSGPAPQPPNKSSTHAPKAPTKNRKTVPPSSKPPSSGPTFAHEGTDFDRDIQQAIQNSLGPSSSPTTNGNGSSSFGPIPADSITIFPDGSTVPTASLPRTVSTADATYRPARMNPLPSRSIPKHSTVYDSLAQDEEGEEVAAKGTPPSTHAARPTNTPRRSGRTSKKPTREHMVPSSSIPNLPADPGSPSGDPPPSSSESDDEDSEFDPSGSDLDDDSTDPNTPRYVCMRVGCQHFHKDYRSRAPFLKHLNNSKCHTSQPWDSSTHQYNWLPYQCGILGCGHFCATAEDLRRHITEQHKMPDATRPLLAALDQERPPLPDLYRRPIPTATDPPPDPNPPPSIHPIRFESAGMPVWHVPHALQRLAAQIATILFLAWTQADSFVSRPRTYPLPRGHADKCARAALELPWCFSLPQDHPAKDTLKAALAAILAVDDTIDAVLDLAARHRLIWIEAEKETHRGGGGGSSEDDPFAASRNFPQVPHPDDPKLNVAAPFNEVRVQHLTEANCTGKALSYLESCMAETKVDSVPSQEVIEKLRSKFPPRDALLDDLPPVETHTVAPTSELPETNPFAPPDAPYSFQLSAEQLTEGIASLPRQSASGMSGWTFELIRTCAHTNKKFTPALLGLFNRILRGDNVSSSPLLLVSRLFALTKDNGDVRPICIGECLFRLLCRCVARALASTAALFLQFQFGVGVKGGTDIAAHITHMLYSAMDDEDLLVVYDKKNAFNSIRRAPIFASLTHADTPPSLRALASLFRFSYGGDSDLCFRNGHHFGKCSTGVRQGDPLGPLFFCMGLHPVLQRLHQMHPEVHILAYLDDVTLYSKIEAVPKGTALPPSALPAHQDYIGLCAEIGLQVNLQKTKSLHRYLPADTNSAVVLGCPLGDAKFVADHIARRVKEATAVLQFLQRLPPHLAFPLIQTCVNARMVYLARLVPPSAGAILFPAFDQLIDKSLLHIMGSSSAALPQVSHIIRALPYKLGGLSIRNLNMISQSAYAASYATALAAVLDRAPLLGDLLFERFSAHVLEKKTSPYEEQINLLYTLMEDQLVNYTEDGSVKIPLALVKCRPGLQNDPDFADDLPEPLTQKTLTTIHVDRPGSAIVLHFLATASQVWPPPPSVDDPPHTIPHEHLWNARSLRANHLSFSYQQSGEPFRLSARRDRKIDPNAVSTLVTQRLLLPFASASDEVIVCGGEGCQSTTPSRADQLMSARALPHGMDPCTHAMCCKKAAGLITTRHNIIRDLFYEKVLVPMFGSAYVHREYALEYNDNDGRRTRVVADIYVESGQTKLCFDITVVNPSARSNVTRCHSDTTPAASATAAYADKKKHYQAALQAHNLDPYSSIIPIVFEDTGRFCDASLNDLNSLANLGGQHSFTPDSVTTSITEVLRTCRIRIARGAHLLSLRFAKQCRPQTSDDPPPDPTDPTRPSSPLAHHDHFDGNAGDDEESRDGSELSRRHDRDE